MSFAKWVGEQTIYRAGFNHWEPSLLIEKNSKSYTVYHTKYPGTDVNVVVIDEFKKRKDGYYRYEFFFRSFPGKSSGECDTEEEVEYFLEELKKTVSRRYRIAGRDLEGKILEIGNESENRTE